jgi:hypothetical protein
VRDRTGDVEGAPVNDQNQTEKKRHRRKEAAPQLTVPATSFDLLEGAAAAQGRTRALNGALLVVVIAVLGTLLSRGVLAQVETRSENSAKTAAQAESATAQEKVRSKRNAGEVSAQAVDEHIEARLAVVREITASEVDVARIVTDLASLGPGVTVTNVTLGADAAKTPQQTSGRGNNKTTTTKPGAISQGVAEANKPQEQQDPASAIRIEGTATSQAAAAEATRQLSDTAKFPYLSAGASGEVSCSTDTNGAQVCTWTWSGQLSDAGLGSRTEDLVARAKQPLADAMARGGN